MSYCRFGPDSDVYVYSNLDGKVECCWCALSETRETVPLTREEMLAHLWDHEQAGHKVPDYATLRGEIASGGSVATMGETNADPPRPALGRTNQVRPI
jgi:hypothetical protein